jgi:predicted nucleotidyltransferase
MIALSSGYFTMRGETSLLSKKNKTQLLLDAGFDIVIEYPLYQLLNSSDFFGKNAINILSKTNITHLAFGIESNNLNDLIQIQNIMDTNEFKKLLNSKLNNKISYKKAIQDTLNEISDFDNNSVDIIMQSNNTLALGYLKALQKHPNIEPFTIKRYGNNEENLTLHNFPSGTALRENYLNNVDISPYLPYEKTKLSNFNNYELKFQTIIENLFLNDSNSYQNYLHINEGIENYIFKNYNKDLSTTENIDYLANKIYSKTRIRRTLLSMILQLPKDLNFDVNNIRILGFSKKGQEYLKYINGNLILNIAKSDDILLKYELKASKLYDILTNGNCFIEEFKFPLKGE